MDTTKHASFGSRILEQQVIWSIT